MTESSPPQYPIDYGRGAQTPHRTSGISIASFILGLLGCVPLITGLLAVVLGVIGIRKGRDPSVRGTGLAVAGLVLGLISVLGWGSVGALLGYSYLESRPAEKVAKQFLTDLDAGNINAATANSATFTPAQLQTQRLQIAPFGALQSITISSFFVATNNGLTTVHLAGTAAFSNGPRKCTFNLARMNGVFKITSYIVQ